MYIGFVKAAIGAAMLAAAASHVLAQNQNTVIVPGHPAPVPLPPPPPANPQPPNAQPKIDTFSDKVSRCMHYGGTVGLPPGQLDSYTRACANN